MNNDFKHASDNGSHKVALAYAVGLALRFPQLGKKPICIKLRSRSGLTLAFDELLMGLGHGFTSGSA